MKKILALIIVGLSFGFLSCAKVPRTVEFDSSISFTEINGYKYHTEIYGQLDVPTLIVVHGGPGDDFGYLRVLKALSNKYRVVFYDQRGSGLSPRVSKEILTLEQNLDDLHAVITHFSQGNQVKLIGHSWGGMLVSAYLGKYPNSISQAVIIEPGMLDKDAAKAFVNKIKESQSIVDFFALIGNILIYPFVSEEDGQEGLDYVMTQMKNRNKAGAPYHCDGVTMPPNSFIRSGYAAFDNMLKPIIDSPESFHYDLTEGIQHYEGDLMLIASECSVFGYEFQKKYHLKKLPQQTLFVKAENMGHTMITLYPEWSLKTLDGFFTLDRF